jgi:hypothetical protein
VAGVDDAALSSEQIAALITFVDALDARAEPPLRRAIAGAATACRSRPGPVSRRPRRSPGSPITIYRRALASGDFDALPTTKTLGVPRRRS